MARFLSWLGVVFCVGIFASTLSGSARGQMSSDPAAITACLCQQQGIATLSAEMSAKTQALAAARQHVADLDAQLLQARQGMDVNNASSVEHYKALLAERDRAYQASLGPVVADASESTARYNAHVNQYNVQCADHQFNADMMAQIQAHLSCPPLQ